MHRNPTTQAACWLQQRTEVAAKVARVGGEKEKAQKQNGEGSDDAGATLAHLGKEQGNDRKDEERAVQKEQAELAECLLQWEGTDEQWNRDDVALVFEPLHT